MLHYDVTFSKCLVSTNGQVFKCVQQVIAVDADSPSEAIHVAKRMFEHDHHIGHWRVHADTVEIAECAEA